MVIPLFVWMVLTCPPRSKFALVPLFVSTLVFLPLALKLWVLPFAPGLELPPGGWLTADLVPVVAPVLVPAFVVVLLPVVVVVLVPVVVVVLVPVVVPVFVPVVVPVCVAPVVLECGAAVFV